ncbi:hypothetical protein Rt10032_c19g6153 [Rhodotorula toruloides]|uniref:Coiled-coil domain-containing protein 43 n=1 Tax=Rhodotorula toruloides TaxID=5286 RepID=A0A511KQI2_RHOTO|nr:hypothetical protein Rt10032_c19g6153 [Rhodotorula toruloides]
MAADLSVPLDELIETKLGALSLRDDDEMVNFVKGLVEEESFEPEDRKSAILGMLEADEEDETTSSAVDELLGETTGYQDAVAARRRAEAAAKAPVKAAVEKAKKPLTAEEEAVRKAELLKTYGYMAEETEGERLEREEAERQAQSDKAYKDPSQMSRKQRKKALEGVDLLALPNLNQHHVQEQERQRREASSKAAQAKKAKDDADRRKQKEDAAKKLEEKRKRAQKVERKG